MADMLLEDYPKTWTGPALTEDLANHLRESNWITVTEMYLPGQNSRVDVMAIKPHAFATKDLRVYEVKVSRQDYHADEGANKWRKYLNVAHRVFFACPAGLLRKDEIPKEAGLIVRGPNGWHVLKSPKGHQPPKLTVDVVFAMLFKVHNTDIEIRELKKRIATEENVALADAAKGIDWRIRERLRGDIAGEIQYQIETGKKFLDWCGKTLGLNPETHSYEIMRILKATPSILAFEDMYRRIEGSIKQLTQGPFASVFQAIQELHDIIAKAKGGGE